MNTHELNKQRGLRPYLYVFTILYFLLGFVAIQTALLALACMSIPFILLSRNKQKSWCHHYCPRASLTTLTGRRKTTWRSLPASFTNGKLRKIMLWYFGMNLLFITGSTIQIAIGRMDPMPYVRLFIAIPLWPLVQIAPLAGPDWLLHLSYRLYSMMLSSTILGLAFARVWRPRAWCAVCPVGTLSNRR